MHAWQPIPSTKSGPPEIARDRLHQISVSHQVSPLMPSWSAAATPPCRRLSVADPAPLCRPGGGELGAGRAGEARLLHVHDVVGRPHRGDLFQGKDAILSGPAGGVVGMVETAKAGFDR
jgi:5-oxoprolinase (ATP-hydrolysing)